MDAIKIDRNCNECTVCCQGFLVGAVFGRTFGLGRKCSFLAETGCSIYDERPQEPCKRFKCGWLQDSYNEFPEWLRPDKSNVIIRNKQTKAGKNFLSISETASHIDPEVFSWFINYQLVSKKNICIQVGGEWKFYGDDDFCKEMTDIKEQPVKLKLYPRKHLYKPK